MVLIAWLFIIGLYLICGILYLQFPQLSPLGALAYPDTVDDVIYISIVGILGVCTGYLLFSKLRTKAIKDFDNPNFMEFSSLWFIFFSFVVFALGVSAYGGYISFLRTPYTAIYQGSAANETKDILISSSGLLAIYALLTSISGKIKKRTLINQLVMLGAILILLSIFIQGRRENLLLLILCFISYYLFGNRFTFKHFLKITSVCISMLFIAGLGLYIRESASTSGGSILTAIPFAIMYETHFSLATLANEVRSHLHNNLPYGGVIELFTPVLFIIPAFLYSLFGLDKQLLFENNELRLYSDKGGQFIFTEAFHSLGIVGVFIHGFVLGAMLITFYRLAKRTGFIIYHFPIVSLVFVSMRKDLTYGIKYISLLFIFLMVFYIIYKILPVKKYMVRN